MYISSKTYMDNRKHTVQTFRISQNRKYYRLSFWEQLCTILISKGPKLKVGWINPSNCQWHHTKKNTNTGHKEGVGQGTDKRSPRNLSGLRTRFFGGRGFSLNYPQKSINSCSRGFLFFLLLPTSCFPPSMRQFLISAFLFPHWQQPIPQVGW